MPNCTYCGVESNTKSTSGYDFYTVSGNFSTRTILAVTRYEKLSEKKKDLADKFLEILGDI
jgi:hypothetical protein